MIKQAIKKLKEEGIIINQTYFAVNKNGKPNKASLGLVFPDYKITVVLYKKYFEDAFKKYPKSWKIYSLGNPGFYKSESDLVNHIIKLLGGKSIVNTNMVSSHKGKTIPKYVLSIYADEMRGKPTEAEECFRNLLNVNDIPFQEQVPMCGKYIADFILYDRIIVEVDGGYHSRKEQIVKDNRRTKDIQKKGYIVVRCSNNEVYDGQFSDALLNRIINGMQSDIPCWAEK